MYGAQKSKTCRTIEKHRSVRCSPVLCLDGTGLQGPLCHLSCTFCCHSSWCWQDPPLGSAHVSSLQQMTLTPPSGGKQRLRHPFQFPIRPNLHLQAPPSSLREGALSSPVSLRLLSLPCHPFYGPFPSASTPSLSLTVLWTLPGPPCIPSLKDRFC